MQDAPPIPEPIANPHLAGHAEAERAMRAAWASGRLHHAWLLTGPRGIGKATLAARFARFVLSGGGEHSGAGPGLFDAEPGLFGAEPGRQAGQGADATGEASASLAVAETHPVFRRIAARGHADFRLVTRSVNPDSGKLRTVIVVDDIRDIGTFLSLTPADGGWRVVMIDAADEMNDSSENALLKVLEEPPRRALLLLVCHNPGRLLPTIRSRCRRLALGPLDDGTVGALIGRYRPDLAAAEAAALVALAEGSIGRALDLAAGGGVALYRDMVALLSGVPRMDVAGLHAFGERVGRGDGAAFTTVAELLQAWLARLVRRAATGAAAPEVVVGEDALAARLGAAAGLDQWVALWEKITYLFARADAVNLDRKQVVLNAFLSVEALVRP